MAKDPMAELLENSNISDDDINSRIKDTLDGIDLSRSGRVKKDKEYDIASLIEDELNSSKSAKGVVQEEDNISEGTGKRNSSKLRESMGMGNKEKTRKSREDDEDSGDSYDEGGETEDKKDNKILKILGVVGAAAYVNNIINKVIRGKPEAGSSGRKRSVLEHIATLIAILVGVAVIISFSFYIVGVMKNQNISSIPGFNEKIEYLLDGRGNKNINVTGIEVEHFTRPYRLLDSGEIEVLGVFNEKILFDRANLSEDVKATGYVYLIYTRDAYSEEVIEMKVQEIPASPTEEKVEDNIMETMNNSLKGLSNKFKNIFGSPK